MSIQKKIRHCVIERSEEDWREESLGLRVVEEAQRKGVEVDNLHMNAKVGPIGSSKPRTEFNKLF